MGPCLCGDPMCYSCGGGYSQMKCVLCGAHVVEDPCKHVRKTDGNYLKKYAKAAKRAEEEIANGEEEQAKLDAQWEKEFEKPGSLEETLRGYDAERDRQEGHSWEKYLT